MNGMEEDWKSIAEDSVVLPWHRVKEILKQAKAEAWDEGFGKGWDRGHYESGDETNPYR